MKGQVLCLPEGALPVHGNTRSLRLEKTYDKPISNVRIQMNSHAPIVTCGATPMNG